MNKQLQGNPLKLDKKFIINTTSLVNVLTLRVLIRFTLNQETVLKGPHAQQT